MGGGVSWSWWMEPWTGIGTSRSWGIKCCHGRWGFLEVTLCTSKTMPHPIQHVTRQLFWIKQDVEVMDWPARSPDMYPIKHVWDQMSVRNWDMDDPPSTVAELNNAVRQAMGCSSARKGASWSRACLIVSGLFWPLKAGTHAASQGQKGNIMFHQYVVNCFNASSCQGSSGR